jgi:hypothetical protein
MLTHGLRNVLKVDPLISESTENAGNPEKIRVMNIFRLENSQFEPLADISKIQNALQVKIDLLIVPQHFLNF